MDCPSNCITCESDIKCLTCDPGYYMNDIDLCVNPCPSNTWGDNVS